MYPDSFTGQKAEGKVHTLVRMALMTAVICILAPLSIPIGPVPISLTNFALFLAIYILGWRSAAVCCAVYILMGAVGLPVFSSFSGGFSILLGPTGGYIIGFIPMVIAAGLFIEHKNQRFLQFVGLALGTLICYGLGTLWFCLVSGSSFGQAVWVCVIPFLPLDLVKIILSVLLGPMIRRRLTAARSGAI